MRPAHDELLASGHLNYEQPLEVGDQVSPVASTIELLLGNSGFGSSFNWLPDHS